MQRKEPKKRRKNPDYLKNNSFYSDTYERYPDIFTLNIGSVVNLDGITLLSGSDGWILNYTVETTPDGASWNLAATVELSNVVLRFIRFENGPLNVKQLRVIITAAMAGYSRISELSPVYAAASISTTDPLTISTTSTHSSTSTSATTATTAAAAAAITNTPPQASSGTKSNTVGIIAGVLGGLTGILLAVLAFSIWLLRKQRNSLVGTGVKGTGHTGAVAGDATQKSPVSGFSYHSNVASELAGQHPEEAGGYPRTELA